MEQPREPIFYSNEIPCLIGVDNKTENTLQSKEFEASENMQSENGKVEVIVIKTENGKLFLMVGNERVEICDFTTRSSAHGETELLVTIKGKTVSTELAANVEQ